MGDTETMEKTWEYFKEHKLQERLQEAVQSVVNANAPAPMLRFSEYFAKLHEESEESTPADYFDPEALLESVEQGWIAPLKGSWLIALHDSKGRLKRRQDLPPEAFWTAAELREIVEKIQIYQDDAHGEIDWGLLFVALSYRWLGKYHPDRWEDNKGHVLENFHLGIVAEAARLYLRKGDAWGSPLTAVFEKAGLKQAPDFAIFWDYCSLYQVDPTDGKRTAEEEASFRRGLKASNIWYGHERSVCWMQTSLPSGFAECSAVAPLAATYFDSGWCFVEAAISSVLTMGRRRLNLAKRTAEVACYGGGWVPEAKLESVCAEGREPPMLPDALHSLLQTRLKFTNGNDSGVVSRLYRTFFSSVESSATRLDFRGVGWGDTEVTKLLKVLRSSSAASHGSPPFALLTDLDLSENSLTEASVSLLAEYVRTPPAGCKPLERLSITGTPGMYEAAQPQLSRQKSTIVDGQSAEELASAVLERSASLPLCCRSRSRRSRPPFRPLRAFGPVCVEELRANTLAELDLHSKGLGPAEGLVLGGLLKTASTSLTTLVLSYNPIRDVGAREIAKSLETHAALATLDLTMCGLSAEGAACLATGLETASSNLKTLALSRNEGIGDEGAKVLGRSLRTNRALETLLLSKCGIGDTGATALAEGLRANVKAAGRLKACVLWRNTDVSGKAWSTDAEEQLRDAVKERPGFKLVLPTGATGMPTKVVVLTGATGAIGKAIARDLQSDSTNPTVSHLVLIVLDEAEGERVAGPLRGNALKVDVLVADLSRMDSIAKCAKTIRETYAQVDVLMNVAAAAPKTLQIVDGLETQFATNVLGGFVLMRELLPMMSSGGRVVQMASELANGLELADLHSPQKVVDQFKNEYDVVKVYAKCKQAVRMLVAEAARPGRGFAEKGVIVTSCHPGIVTSTLLSSLGFQYGIHSPSAAAQTPIKLALAPPEGLDLELDKHSGTYWVDKKQVPAAVDRVTAHNADACAALWQACEQLAKEHLGV